MELLVIFLGQLTHPHLVKLIGYCCEDEHRLLVYEYIARENFDNQLVSTVSVSKGSHLKFVDLCPGNGCLTKSTFKTSQRTSRKSLAVQASYRPSSGSIFISGFVLGGIVIGTLGAVYAPQISKALAGAEKNDLLRKLPKFIYDEERALERTRTILYEKIEQLNSAIDDVFSQLRTEDSPNGLAVEYSVSLPWLTRLKIAVDAAKGLAFLHFEEPPIIYRDFKASNILLDSDYSAKVSDFGLALGGPEGVDAHVTTSVMGIEGYAAPDYILTVLFCSLVSMRAHTHCDVPLDDVEVSDEDLDFIKENIQHVGFLNTLDTQSITRRK